MLSWPSPGELLKRFLLRDKWRAEWDSGWCAFIGEKSRMMFWSHGDNSSIHPLERVNHDVIIYRCMPFLLMDELPKNLRSWQSEDAALWAATFGEGDGHYKRANFATQPYWVMFLMIHSPKDSDWMQEISPSIYIHTSINCYHKCTIYTVCTIIINYI